VRKYHPDLTSILSTWSRTYIRKEARIVFQPAEAKACVVSGFQALGLALLRRQQLP